MDEKPESPTLPDLLQRDEPSEAFSDRVGIKFEGISLEVQNSQVKKKILLNLNGYFPSGQLSAIVGPSGSGKSTLLDVLAGHKRPSEGSVAPWGQRRRLISQQCVFPEVLTTLELLSVAAALKLNSSNADRRSAVRRVLTDLGLTECARTTCATLSGGQRKRLSIALELIDEPPVLLLDEPTTGLDYVSGMRCIRLLQNLSRLESRTIVCTIHQPSALILELIDQIYLLSAGRCLYKGAVDGLLPKLSSNGLSCPKYHNPSDFALDIACGEYGVEVVNEFALGEEMNIPNTAFPAELNGRDKGPAASFLTQFSVLLRRSLFIMTQEKSVTLIKIFVHIIVAILLGATFYNCGNDAARVLNNGALHVCIQIFLLFSGLIPTVLTFPMEKSVFKREFSNCWYSLEAYFLAMFTSHLPLPICNSLLFTSIVYWMSGQPANIHTFLLMLLVTSLTSLNAQSVGILVGVAFNLVNGMFFASFSGVPQLVFCGYFIAVSAAPFFIRIFAHATSYVLYSFHAAMATTYGHGRPNLQCDEMYCYFRSPKKFLDFLQITEEGVGLDVAALFIFLFAFNIITYSVMKLKYSHLQR
ncbi:ATP-binding cassette sub-family G member 4-like [Neocloeon triangulifer]|uniref:ATP-binding cassette sub-family G member 4-like n=1 Tax=Neocloeon triangulifer TaxID=2078957 RepID=UPI00286F3C49|nr:ATP-binding cassette sub-family G member 4-like [Neocloeon triangulifer]